MRKIVVAFIALWSMIVAGGGSAQCAEINQANNTQIIRSVVTGDEGCAIVPAFFSFFSFIYWG